MYPRNFDASTNYLSPSPNWDYQPTDLPISTTPPLAESDMGSVNFELWREIGQSVLIKNTLNNWVTCDPNGGSLVDMRTGPMLCNVTKVIVEGVCEDIVPSIFEKHGHVVGLFAPTPPGGYYFLYTKGKSSWAVSDPCGVSQQNQLKNVLNPAGWLYVKEIKRDDPHIMKIFDANNSSSKYFSRGITFSNIITKVKTIMFWTHV